MKPQTKAHFALIGANLLFGINFSMVKHIAPSVIQPFALNVIRAVVTTSLLWMIYPFQKDRKPVMLSDIPLFIACGLTGIAINQLLFIKGLSMTYSIHASLLMLCTPLLITISAFVFLKEGISGKMLGGLAIGITGAILLISTKENSGKGNDILLGDIFIALNAASYALYFVLVKPLMQRYPPLQVLTLAFTFGMLVIIPFGWTELRHTDWSRFDTTHFGALFMVVIGATFMTYVLTIYGLRQLPATSSGSYIYLQPLFATAVATIFLDEHFGLLRLIAALLIFTGVYLVQRNQTKKSEPSRK